MNNTIFDATRADNYKINNSKKDNWLKMESRKINIETSTYTS